MLLQREDRASERPRCGLRLLSTVTKSRGEREREREGEKREEGERGGGWMGDGLRGGHAGITIIKKPLTAHTTPEQLSDERRRRGREGREGRGSGGIEGGRSPLMGSGGGGRKNVQAQQK